MSRFKVVILLIVPTIMGMFISTQLFAAQIEYNAHFLGTGFLPDWAVKAFKFDLYAPWRYIGWFFKYHHYVGDIFASTCVYLFIGLFLTIIGFILCRPKKQLSSHGTARWSEYADLLKMDLISSHGCVIGLYDSPFKKFLTSVLRSLENAKKEKVSNAEMEFDRKIAKDLENISDKVRELKNSLDDITNDKRKKYIEAKIVQYEKILDNPPKYNPKSSWNVYFYVWIHKKFLKIYKKLSHFYLRDNSNKHLAVIAPTRSGKGVGLIVPTLLGGWNESVIVNDIKSENWGITSGFRKLMGQKVIKFEPTSDDGSTARWNPLDEIPIGDPMEVSMAQNLASIIADFEGKGKPDHWTANAANVIMAVILHLKYAHFADPEKYPNPPNLYTVAAFLKVNSTNNAQKSRNKEEIQNDNYEEKSDFTEFDESEVDDEVYDEDMDDKMLNALAQNEKMLINIQNVAEIDKMDLKNQNSSFNADSNNNEKTKPDVAGFVDTIKDLLKFHHVPKGGLKIKKWSTKERKYVTEIITVEKLHEMYPDAESLRTPGYEYTHPIVMQAFSEIYSKPDNELGSIVSTANTALKEYLDPVLARNTSVSDFCIDDMMNYRKPVSLYLVTPPSDLLRLAPIFRLFFEMMVRHHARKIGEYQNGQAKAVYKHKCLFLMDEFSSLGNLQSFAATLSYIAGYGMKVFLINQGLPQINGIYGKDNQILMNCHLQIFYAPNDNDTGKYAESLLGNKTIIVENISDNGNGGIFARKNISRSETGRALMTADELKRLGDQEIIVASGSPPVLTDKIKYYENNFFLDKLIDAPKVSDLIREGEAENVYKERDTLLEKVKKKNPNKEKKKIKNKKYVSYFEKNQEGG